MTLHGGFHSTRFGRRNPGFFGDFFRRLSRLDVGEAHFIEPHDAYFRVDDAVADPECGENQEPHVGCKESPSVEGRPREDVEKGFVVLTRRDDLNFPRKLHSTLKITSREMS